MKKKHIKLTYRTMKLVEINLNTYLILLAFNNANLGFTFSSPITKYSLTIQKTAALRTIDSSTSAN